MLFKPMKPEDVRKALEGHKDILAKANEESEAFFKRTSCPSCGGDVMRVVNARKPFREGDILPNYLAKCKICQKEFEPGTRL